MDRLKDHIAIPEIDQPASTRFSWRWLVPAMVVCCLALVLFNPINLLLKADFHTNYGERRTIQLSDGSTVYLNSNTALSVNLSAEQKHLTLLKGEAWFKVRTDSKAYRVKAGPGTVTALGTAFNIRLLDRDTDASTAKKTDTLIMETPYAVTVVPQQVLKDQRFIRVEDGLKNVAGVQPGFTNGGDSDTFQMRGFQNDNLYRDGFLLPSALSGGTLKRQTTNLERIEVFKGRGSILYGRNQPGGVINLVTKRPQATPYHSVEQQFGSYDFYRTLVDSTGAITSDDELLYRVNLSYENAGSFRDFVKTDTVFLAPSFTWNVTDQTQANLDIEYQHFDNTNDSGIPPMGSRPAPVPINRQTGDPFNNKTVGDRTYVGANWSHEFNDDWKLNHRFGAEFLDMASDFTFFFSPTDAAGNLVNVNNDFSNGGTRGFNNGTTQQQEYSPRLI
ncbi:MAG: TonB-dependent receptor plug domain-containing protein [Methylovulum sp.]